MSDYATCRWNKWRVVLYSLPSSSHIILLGDFNITDVNWSSLDAHSLSSSTFCDHVFALNLTQLVHVPTHSHGNVLDLIFSNDPELLSNIGVNPSISDHYIISCNLQTSHTTSVSTTRYKWSYSRADLPGLLDHLLDSDLDSCILLEDVDTIWNLIRDTVINARYLFVPQVQVSKSPTLPWFNAEIHHKINVTRTLRRRYRLKPTEHLLLKLQSSETSLQQNISASKSEYIEQLLVKYRSEPSKLFNHLCRLSKPDSSTYPIIHDSEPVTNSDLKAELFNNYFNSVFIESDFTMPPPDERPTPTNQLNHYYY